MLREKAVKKIFPEAARSGKATTFAVGLIAVFAAMTTVAASGMPFFEIEEVNIE